MSTPQLSVVIPVYNEEQGLQALFDRLYPALDKLGISYEVLFVNDGSRDRSAAILREQFQARPDVTRVILFNGNFGQHMAIMAGFEHTRGQRVVTLDADLQNPPEEIAKLLAKMDEGFDYIGSIRKQRSDSWWRHVASRAMNNLRERTTRIKITDQGCMLRAYDRGIIDAINSCKEVNTFIPALAYTFARKPAEVVVEHEERTLGESKYSLYSLIRLNFDLMTGFSVVPLQMFSMLGIAISVLSSFFVVFLFVRRLIIGPEAEGLFTLFAIAFFLIGITLFGIGLLGEYVGRIYQQVRHRPRYLVEAVLEEQGKGEMARGKGQKTISVAGEFDPFDVTPDGATSHLTDKTTSHSTRLSKDDNQVAGYKPASEKLLDGHPKDAGQVTGYSHSTKKKAGPIDDAAHPPLFSDSQE